MPGQPYEPPQITDLGSLDDLVDGDAHAGVSVTGDDGQLVSFDTSGGPI